MNVYSLTWDKRIILAFGSEWKVKFTTLFKEKQEMNYLQGECEGKQ